MKITATELKTNLSHYLELSKTENVYITQYGKIVSMLSNPHLDKMEIVESLFGIAKSDMTVEQINEERLKKHESID